MAKGRQRRDSASQVMQRLEFDPLKVLVDQANKMIKDDPNSKELRSLCTELLPYSYPKLRNVDATVQGLGDITVTIGSAPKSPLRGEDVNSPQSGNTQLGGDE